MYQFGTCDTVSSKVSLTKDIKSPDDIDGIWTYLYFSYSHKEKQTVGFIKYGER